MRRSTPGRRSETKNSEQSYCPDYGEIVWLDFSPQKGREQGGRRPALVLSPRAYNRFAGLCLACPITSRTKGYRFEVPLPDHGTVKGGVVLADQVKSISWDKRRAEYAGLAPREVVLHARAKIRALLQIP
jgi:mRNA interferase MazF